MASGTPTRGDAVRLPRKKWTNEKKARFLEVLGEALNISEAARAVQMDRTGAYALKDRDPAFAQSWRAALDKAYDEVELRLLRDSRDGATRTETVHDAQSGAIKQTKTVHDYPHAVAIRLFLSHQQEVAEHRTALAQARNDEDVIARVRAHMDEVRARLQKRAAAADAAQTDDA